MSSAASISLIERAARRLVERREDGPPSAHPKPQLETSQGAAIEKHVEFSPAVSSHAESEQGVKVDFRRLESFGVFSPDRGYNRTTEEVRIVKRAALLNVEKAKAAKARNPNLIMVTSSRQGEGKSFIAFNLALSLAAETDKTVLFIDVDSNRSSVLRILGLESRLGFLDMLEDSQIEFDDAVIRTDVPRLSIIPAGRPHPLSSELLAGSRAGQILDEMSRRYHDRIIIVDAPPVLATSEPTAMALHVGQILFVVDSSRTTKSAIKEALGLVSVCENIGFVLNKADYQFGAARFGAYYDYYDQHRSGSQKERRRRRQSRQAS